MKLALLQQKQPAEAVKSLTPTTEQRFTTRLASRFLTSYHYQSEELDDAHEAKLHLMLEGARGEDVHLEAFLRVVADDHSLEVGAKAREEPKSPMQARLRKKRRSRTGSRPKSATKLRPKSATRL